MGTTARTLRTASTRALRDAVAAGHPVDPRALAGWAYRGTSLGLPEAIARLTWKTFQKTFYRDPETGRLLGYNVRLEQDGIDAPSRPRTRHGRPVTEWYYEVIPPEGVPAPPGFDRGLIIDYSRGPNPPGVVRLVKDPLVALAPGDADELLGVSYLVIGGRCVETPTYFTLERDHRLDPAQIPAPPATLVDPLRLTRVERAWAEAIFSSILGAGGDDGLPAFASIDPTAFWSRFDAAAAPLVRAGLRPMLYTITFLPLATGFGAPFPALPPDARARFLAEAARSRRTFVRQSLAALKTLACFAYFDDPAVRARYEGAA
jgi:hypothetical protein